VFAKNIASGIGFAYPAGELTAYWPVGTSAVYAIFYKIFGFYNAPVVIFNIAIGSLLVWLTYGVTKQHLNHSTAIIASLLVAIWPALIQFSTIYSSELFFTVLLFSAIYVWGNKKIKPVYRAMLWGALICGATYVRPTALLLLVFFPILEFFTKRTIRQCVVSFGIASVTAAMLFAPWTYRNHQVFDQFVLVSTNGGANLWMGNHEGSNGRYTPLPDLGFVNEAERDDYFKKEAINFILNNPGEYLKLCVQRAIHTYSVETIGISWNGSLYRNFHDHTIFGMKLISTFYWWLMLALAAVGIYQLLKHGRMSIFNILLVTFGFFFIFPIFTVGQDRYHIPLNPFLAVFSAYYLNTILMKRVRKKL